MPPDLSQISDADLLASLGLPARSAPPVAQSPGDLGTVSDADLLRSLGRAPKTGPENTLAGSAKALGTGALRGGAGLLGAPADIANLAAQGLDWARGTDTAVPATKEYTQGYTGEDLQKALETRTGPLYEPQTGLERTLTTVGSMAPGIIAGPGGIVRRALTNVVAPGLASEAAGAAAQGTGYEPAARIAGALAGNVGAAMGARAAVGARGLPAVPTGAQIDAATTAAYSTPALQQVRYAPAFADQTATRIETQLRQARFSPTDPATASVYGLINDMRTPQLAAPLHTFQDFDATRRRLQEIAGQGGSGGAAAQRAIATLDQSLDTVPRSFVVAGDARQAAADIATARASARVGFRSDLVDQFLERAGNTAAATHSGANIENEIYKQVRSALNSNTALRGWPAADVAALRSVLPGIGSTIVRGAGKLMGGGGGLGAVVAGGAGAHMFGPIGAAAVPLMGMALNRLGGNMARSRLQAVGQQIRAQSPLYGAANLAARQQALGGGVLGGMPGPQQLALQAALAARMQQLQGQ